MINERAPLVRPISYQVQRLAKAPSTLTKANVMYTCRTVEYFINCLEATISALYLRLRSITAAGALPRLDV